MAIVYVCKCWLDLHLLDQPESLKAKRSVIKGIKEKLISRFRVSAAEVGSFDLWQRAEIGIAFVTNDGTLAGEILDRILRTLEGMHPVEIVDIYREIEKIP